MTMEELKDITAPMTDAEAMVTDFVIGVAVGFTLSQLLGC